MRVEALIGSGPDNLRPLDFLVDTDSFLTVLPANLALELGILATLIAPVIVADSRTVDAGQGLAYLSLLGRGSGIPVAIMDVPLPLLGVSALEVLGLKVNPVAVTFEYDRPFRAAVLSTGAK